MILADTSVWIQHFRAGSARLRELLAEDEIMVHPAVIGELATGNLRQRETTLALLLSLQRSKVATFEECLGTISAQRLYGQGIGWIDVQLLVSARLSRVLLWSLDQRLRKAAEAFGVAYAQDTLASRRPER